MKQKMEDIANAVLLMEQYLKENLIDRDGNLQEKKLWENTFIKKQIDKREKGGTFKLGDHIRAMVYSMLSAGMKWEKVEKYIDEDTSRITVVDEIFHQYDCEVLLQCNPSDLRNEIKGLHCATQLTYKQMEALIHSTNNT